MNKSCKLAVSLLLLSLVSLPSPAAHIRETMTLAKGWNAIYLESTPTNAACADFFAGAPVARVASYQSDAYSSTRQIADDGTTIDQKPLSYRVWVPGDETASTLTALRGGCVYLIYATDAWTKTDFLGVPAAPRQTWRATSGETGFMNLVGVSADANASVTARAYFGEGPFGTASGTAYQIAGTKTAAPTFLSLGLASSPKVKGGQAYALSATKDGDWPGVIGVLGDAVAFGADANYASIKVQNRGTKARAFRMSILEPNETTEQIFSLDRSQLVAGTAYGAILVIEDLGGSQMRVRLPVAAAVGSSDAVAYPTGLWVGQIALTQVSGIDDATPVAAGGTLKMNVMLHVDADGACTLLQRAALGVDTNGTARLFKEFSSVPAEVENPRRLSMVMMSVDTPVVAAGEGAKFGDAAGFSWTVDAKARDNPFRHAWHPDHDGKKADYSGDAPSGDDFGNYAQPVKPELWSISNRLDFSWHEDGIGAKPVNFPYNADETTSGVVTWEVTGLVSKGPIKSVGTFTLKRVFKAKNLE